LGSPCGGVLSVRWCRARRTPQQAADRGGRGSAKPEGSAAWPFCEKKAGRIFLAALLDFSEDDLEAGAARSGPSQGRPAAHRFQVAYTFSRFRGPEQMLADIIGLGAIALKPTTSRLPPDPSDRSCPIARGGRSLSPSFQDFTRNGQPKAGRLPSRSPNRAGPGPSKTPKAQAKRALGEARAGFGQRVRYDGKLRVKALKADGIAKVKMGTVLERIQPRRARRR